MPSTRQAQTGQELSVGNINLTFTFDAAVNRLSINFADFGGSENLAVNGDLRIVNNLSDLNGTNVGGALITDNTDDYPAWDDIVAEYKKIGTALADGVRKLTTAELDGDLRGEVPDQFKEMFGNTEKTIATMIRHDSHHRGQIAMIAALGD